MAPAAVWAQLAGIAARALPAGTTVQLDKLLADPVWEQAPRFNAFVERAPVNAGLPSQQTSVQVLFDGRDIYVGVRAEDHRPELIRARLGPHDSVGAEQDSVAVLIDSVGSRKAAQYFRVNPLGATSDGMYTADTDSEDLAPDYEFEARAGRDGAGYSAVFRIPFSSLRFAAQGRGAWRMLVRRTMPRDIVYEYLSVLIPPHAYDLISTAPVIEGLEPPGDGSFLKLTPALVLGRTSTPTAGEPVQRARMLKPSLDIKWRPANEVVIDATLRPDFSQVDLDVPQLSGNTRYALYLQEKRPFFQESSDLWQMPTTQLYTRAVTRPEWGLRATRRNDRFAGTLFAARDEGGGVVQLPGPWATASVAQPGNRIAATRLRWDSPKGHLAMLGIDRQYDGASGGNRVLGTDFALRLNEGMKVRGQLLGSDTSAHVDANGRLAKAAAVHGSHLWLGMLQRAAEVESSIQVEHISPGFRNDTGFLPQTGVRTVSGDVNRVWRNLGGYAETWAYVAAAHTTSATGGLTVQRFARPGLYLKHENGLELVGELRAFDQQRVQPGSALHAQRYLHLELYAYPSALVPRVKASLDAGRMVDVTADRVGPAHRASAEVQLLPTSRSSLTASASHQADSLFGRQHYAELSFQFSAVYATAPGQDIRLLLTRRRMSRVPQPLDSGDPVDERDDAVSLSYRWVWSRYRALYLGATRERTVRGGAGVSTSEIYLKAVYGVEP
jgi:hypothetical protein